MDREQKELWRASARGLLDGFSVEDSPKKVLVFGRNVGFRRYVGFRLHSKKKMEVRYGVVPDEVPDYHIDADALLRQYKEGRKRKFRGDKFNFRVNF